MSLLTVDPMEQLIEQALIDAGISYRTDRGGGNEARLDFHLPDHDLYIEVKRWHSERASAQLSRAPHVILVQGETAIRWLADLIRKGAITAIGSKASIE